MTTEGISTSHISPPLTTIQPKKITESDKTPESQTTTPTVKDPSKFTEPKPKMLGSEHEEKLLMQKLAETSSSELLSRAKILPTLQEMGLLNNESLQQLVDDKSILFSDRLQTLTHLKTGSDPYIQQNSFKILRNTNMKTLRSQHANLLGTYQHLQIQTQELRNQFSDDPKLAAQLDHIANLETSLNKSLFSLGKALANNEDVTSQVKQLEKLQTKLATEIDKLSVDTTTGDEALTRYKTLKKHALVLKVQQSQLDTFMQIKNIGDNNLKFFTSVSFKFLDTPFNLNLADVLPEDVSPESIRLEDLHNRMKSSASEKGYTEGKENTRNFARLVNIVDFDFMHKLDQVKGIDDPKQQHTALLELLRTFQSRRIEDMLDDFFIDFMLNEIKEDREIRKRSHQTVSRVDGKGGTHFSTGSQKFA